ncbi:isochorismatase family protein [Falsirhodobacter sp. alg1]|uniref:isochorismatase family protein n=1 Tax=Falsirhodobacter sp. alg1 TaxID=1472418 RepID=UPI0005EFD5CA|nr:isochorismatase family protein [Falsirhodobacter sp. alg1]
MALPSIASYPLPAADALPPSRAKWPFAPDQAALLIHDMQRYFCAPFASDAAPLTDIVRNIAALATAARACGMPVFYTAQEGEQLRADRGLQADLWGPGMSRRPEHQDILPELAPVGDDIVLVKHRYSAFQRSNLETLMRARGRRQLLVTGIYAHIGCLATAAEAFQRDIEPFAVADAQADFTATDHAMALDWVARCCGRVVATQDLLAAMQGASQCN